MNLNQRKNQEIGIFQNLALSSIKKTKIKIAYITSPRELEDEGVGSDRRINPTLDFLYNQISTNPFLSNCELSAVVVDDMGGKTQNAFNHLKNFSENNNITFQVILSKPFRKIPLNEKTKKANQKQIYEQEMLNFMRRNNIDLIISDSYCVFFDKTMLDPYTGYVGLILNLHPANTQELPGISPTKDAVVRANLYKQIEYSGDFALIKINNEESTIQRILDNLNITYVKENGYFILKKQDVKHISKAKTGATLHYVDAGMDTGQPIYINNSTPVLTRDGVHDLRIRNYQTKNKTLLIGLLMFLKDKSNIFNIQQNRMRNNLEIPNSLKAPLRRGIENEQQRIRI